ncbi:hypothetical protein CA606_20010 [Caulobacter vibrioides]|uniref:Uncharacterized protein n=1 Tax=Caulobacter vibrioides TaxID=155892 RepID=A0A291IDB9_CAUVI|nr:hypothetical protein CA606_20010 [Caulobacter vibrioides]
MRRPVFVWGCSRCVRALVRMEILVRSLSSGRPPVGPGGQAQDEDFVRAGADSRPHPELVEGRGRP